MFEFVIRAKPRLGHHLGIFLDVDGVLNTEADWHQPLTLNRRCVKAFQSAMKLASTRFDKVSVILSSSWRLGWNPTNQPCHLRELCRVVPIAGITPQAQSALPKGQRGREIRYYLRRHEMDAYVVVDDDIELFSQDDRATMPILLTDARTGFTLAGGKRLIELVKKWSARVSESHDSLF